MRLACVKCGHTNHVEVGTASDVAREHRVTREAVAGWLRTHKDHPAPVDVVRGGERLYDLAEWRDFCTQKGLGRR